MSLIYKAVWSSNAASCLHPITSLLGEGIRQPTKSKSTAAESEHGSWYDEGIDPPGMNTSLRSQQYPASGPKRFQEDTPPFASCSRWHQIHVIRVHHTRRSTRRTMPPLIRLQTGRSFATEPSVLPPAHLMTDIGQVKHSEVLRRVAGVV